PAPLFGPVPVLYLVPVLAPAAVLGLVPVRDAVASVLHPAPIRVLALARGLAAAGVADPVRAVLPRGGRRHPGLPRRRRRRRDRHRGHRRPAPGLAPGCLPD